MPSQTSRSRRAEQLSMAALLGADTGPVTTPGTRVTWSTVREWIDASNMLHHRRAASKTYHQQAAHLTALTREVIERETDQAALADLLALLRSRRYVEPRGQRAGTHRTRLVDYVHNQIQKLRAGSRGAGGATRGILTTASATSNPCP